MTSEKVLYEKRGRIAVITLNRPEVKNAIDPEMDRRLAEIWTDFRDDAELDVAIWTGADGTFCSGADRTTWFAEWVEADSLTVRENAGSVGFGGLTRGLHRIDKPIIAAIDGWALGGALECALACDIRIATDRARFGLPLVRFGFHTGDGGITRLLATCGLSVLMDLQLTGEAVDAQRALACGLVSRVVAPDTLMTTALEVAERILANDQFAVRSAKATTLELAGRPLDEQLRLEALYGYSLAARARSVIETLQDAETEPAPRAS